jgi:hypothetical protein
MLPPTPPTEVVKFCGDEAAVAEEVENLRLAFKHCFQEALTVYTRQYKYKERSRQLKKAVEKQRMLDSANATARQLIPGGTQATKIHAEISRKKLKAATVTAKRELQSADSQLYNEKCKRVRLEQKLKESENKLKAAQERLERLKTEKSSKDRGAPAQGATQTNPTDTTTLDSQTPTETTTTASLSKNRRRRRSRGKRKENKQHSKAADAAPDSTAVSPPQEGSKQSSNANYVKKGNSLKRKKNK